MRRRFVLNHTPGVSDIAKPERIGSADQILPLGHPGDRVSWSKPHEPGG